MIIFCGECEKKTEHAMTNPAGEVAMRIVAGILTAGLTEMGLPKDREVQCKGCGNLSSIID